MSIASHVDGARALQRHWFSTEKLEIEINRAFDRIGFTDDLVTYSISRNANGKRKAIKDSVWGMMEFDDAAMRLIDSPILQRLRRIRQLGFTPHTYPSAEHSRFIHSVGMAHVVSQFVEAIERRHGGVGSTLKSDIHYATFSALAPLKPSELIHAALLHDIGHLPFSHAAESALEAASDHFSFAGLSHSEFHGHVEDHLGGSVSLSEALSIFVVLSPRFDRFYREHVVQAPSDLDAVLRIACLIAGQPPVSNCRNIQHLISSSAVDADKIDYVSRDAQACGIPVGVDVSRVYLGSSLLKLSAKIANQLGYGEEETHVFALNASGWDTFDEITRSRSTLYQRVYLHPVTRTSEALFARALQLNAQSLFTGGHQDRLKDAITLWAESDDSVLDILATSPDPAVSAAGIDIRDRHLPKKACALSGQLLRPQAPFDNILRDLLGDKVGDIARLRMTAFEDRLSRKNSATLGAVEFENEVIKEAHALRDLIKEHEPGLAPSGDLSTLALIKIATLDTNVSDAPVFQHGELVPADQFTNARGVADASEMFRATGFVMSSLEWRELALIATQAVLYRHSLAFEPYEIGASASENAVVGDKPFRFQFSPITLLDIDDVVRRVGAMRDDVRRLYAAAEKTEYFDSMPLLAKPTSKTSGPIRHIAEKYRAFEGQEGWAISASSVAAFVDQFPPKFREEIISALSSGVYLGQAQITNGLKAAVQTISSSWAQGKKLILAPLSPSSGGSSSSFAKVTLKNHTFASALSESIRLADADSAIVLLDDNAASGTQASAQMYAYQGTARVARPEALRSESGVYETPLTPEEWERLRAIPFGIGVALGHQTADVTTRAFAKKLGIREYHGVSFDRAIGASFEWSPELRVWLSEVGRELIAGDRYGVEYANAEPAQKDICDEHAFGYGGFGGMAVTSFNVPASTVTALWMPGRFEGRPWIPLFLRRGRLERLVIA